MRRQYAHRAPIRALCEGSSMRLYRAGILLLAYPIDKTIFPRILNPRGAKRVGYRQSELRLATWRTRSSCSPGFSIKRIFPNTDPAGPVRTGPSTIPTRSRPWTLPGSPGMYRCWGHPAQVSCAHLSPGARSNEFYPNTRKYFYT